MIRLLIAFICALASSVAVLVPVAAADVFKLLPEYEMNYAGTPGPVAAEGGAGSGEWVWFADLDEDLARTELHRFMPLWTPEAVDEVQPYWSPPYFSEEGEIGLVSDLLYDSRGDWVFIADKTNHRILWYRHHEDPPPAEAFDADSVGQIPGPVMAGDAGEGAGPGEFSSDLGTMAVLNHSVDGDQLLVADSGNNRVQVLDIEQSGLTHNFDIVTSGTPEAVTVDGHNGLIWISQSSGPSFEIYDENGTFVTGFTPVPNTGVYDDIEYNGNEHVVYASNAASLDIFSTNTYARLGTYPFTKFSEEPNMPGDTGTRMIKSFALESASSWIHVVTFNPDDPPNNGNPKPAQVFLTSIWPTCTIAPPIDVQPGQTITITPECDDDDGAPVQEFTLDGSPSLGTAGERPGYDGIDYTAPLDGSGLTNVPFRVTTMNGRSQLYQQPVNVVAAAEPEPPAPAPLETPTYRDDSNLSRSSGQIMIQLPGTNTFVPLEKDTVVPLGTIVDATKGEAVVTWARPDGTTYSARFWAGVFQILQTTGKDPIGEVKLRDDLVTRAAGARATTAAGLASASAQFEAWITAKKKKKGKRKNKVWGSGKGKFRSSGNNSSASVRGTVWLVENYQRATRTYVKSGVVDVRDKRKKKTIRLRKGKSYVAYRR